MPLIAKEPTTDNKGRLYTVKMVNPEDHNEHGPSTYKIEQETNTGLFKLYKRAQQYTLVRRWELVFCSWNLPDCQSRIYQIENGEVKKDNDKIISFGEIEYK